MYLGHDPLTGKKRYVTQTVRGGEREAQTALAETVTEAERGPCRRRHHRRHHPTGGLRRMIWAFSDESERAATMLFGVLLIEPGAVAASRAALAELRLPGQRSWAAYCETEWSLRAA